MLRYFLTLKKIAGELSLLNNFRIIECYTQEKNSIIIELFNGSERKFLEINLNNNIESIFLHKNFARARINSLDLFDIIIGKDVVKIDTLFENRILQIYANDLIINIVLFGFSKNNIFITDNNLKLLKQFKSNFSFDLTQFNQPFEKEELIKENTLSQALKKSYYKFNNTLIDEFCFENSYDKDLFMNDIDDYFFQQIKYQAEKFYNNIEKTNKSYIIENALGMVKFSLIPLNHYGKIKYEFSNINDGLRKFKSEYLQSNLLKSNKVSLLQNLISQQKKIKNKVNSIQNLLNEKNLINDYKLFGDLILSYPNQKATGLQILRTVDWENNEIAIKLDKNKTLVENAAKYYEKSKKLKEEIEVKSSWLKSLNDKLSKLQLLLGELELIENLKELKKFEIKVKELESDSNKSIIASESDKFRVFDLGSGYILYVGKSAANNDELTVKFAKPNDLWFHARGSAGSHAIIRLKKEENPPKEIIKKAASIVAYYSQARNAKYVPVCYTFKKYVRKPKGANPGSVVLQRESVVMVEPKLPE